MKPLRVIIHHLQCLFAPHCLLFVRIFCYLFIVLYSPDANDLCLISQVLTTAAVVVVRSNCAHSIGGEEVLGAAGRGEVTVVAAVLGHL